jgi:hypothetical protein
MLVACTFAAESQLTPTLPATAGVSSQVVGTFPPTDTPFPATITSSPSPKITFPPPPVRTAASTQTDTPALADLAWAEGIAPQILPDYNGLNKITSWSPTADEILFLDCESGKTNIARATAPDFKTIVLSDQSACTSAIWSPDGQSIVYVDTENNIQIVKRDGGESHRVNTTENLQYPTLPGWIDSQNLVYWWYAGGGHGTYAIVDIPTGKERIIASVPGGMETPNADYIPITYATDPQLFNLLVVSEKLPVSNEPIPELFANGHYLPFPEFNSIPVSQTIAVFEGWLPNTDQILVAWKHYTLPEWEIQKEHLLLWNIGANTATIIAPNGTQGLFSSDGRYLAYNTRGPAKLDQDNLPIDNDSSYRVKVYESPDDKPVEYTTYMQVLDMGNKKVNLSLPSWEMNFSPNGRYLAFRTSGAVQVDNSKWTVGIVQGEEKIDYINILDLWTGKLAFSLTDISALPDWAPDSDRFLYRDTQRNLFLHSISNDTSIAITRSLGKFEVRQIDWSHDGQYFMVRMTHEQDNLSYYDVAVIKAP